MTMKKDKLLRLVSTAAVIAAAGMVLGACASRAEHDLYERIAFPEQRANPAGQQPVTPAPAYDRLGGGSGAGGGGGGGGGGH